jgi:hypothetical protein
MPMVFQMYPDFRAGIIVYLKEYRLEDLFEEKRTMTSDRMFPIDLGLGVDGCVPTHVVLFVLYQ